MMKGREAVIDKDRTAALLAPKKLSADALLSATECPAVFRDFAARAKAPSETRRL